jgi:branched-chain amino acid transport system ATP-binding protein
MGHLLDVNQVNKSFGGLVAVNGMSMFVEQGDMLGLVGPNGSGKTTLFNMITGIYKPDAGSISFDGDRISGLKPHKISGLGLARTFQIVRPFPRMSVVENVMAAALFGNRSVSTRGARERTLELLAYTSLSEKAQTRAGSLTLAEQRRLELARALATNPKLLMLDEVMAGLSQTEIASVVQLLQKIRQDRGTTMIITEHVMRAIVQLCNRMVVMNQGQRLAEGTPSEVMRESSVIAAYMGEKKRVFSHNENNK